MTIYAAGWNMAGYGPNPDSVAEFRTREDALAYLLEELDYFTESAEIECDHDDEKQGSFDAQLESARADLKTVGSVTVSDYDDARHVFWLMPITEPRYAYPGDDEIMTAEEALEDWLSSIELGLDEIEMEELFSMTHYQYTAEHNLSAIAYAADYFGIDLSDDPLPIKMEGN